MDALSLTPSFLLAAGDWFEIVAALIFFLVTGIAQWLQKRSKERRGLSPEAETETVETPWDEPPPPRPHYTPPPPLATEQRAPREMDIEEQLRRLLNPGLPVEPPPLPPRIPAPAPRASTYGDESESAPWEESEGPSRPVVALDRADAAYKRGANMESTVAARLSSAANFAATSAAFQHASDISGYVSARIRHALGKASHPASSTSTLLGSRFSPAAQSLAATLRNPSTARQAVLVAMVLQPPKALEDPNTSR